MQKTAGTHQMDPNRCWLNCFLPLQMMRGKAYVKRRSHEVRHSCDELLGQNRGGEVTYYTLLSLSLSTTYHPINTLPLPHYTVSSHPCAILCLILQAFGPNIATPLQYLTAHRNIFHRTCTVQCCHDLPRCWLPCGSSCLCIHVSCHRLSQGF